MARIAYLGPQGTFSEAAMLQLVADDPDFEPVACDSTGAALEAVRMAAADYACVPIENSIEGSVLPTMDSLSSGSGVQIFAEHTLDVAFSIVVRPGVTAEVRRWLAEQLPHATLVPAISNAGAAQQVSEGLVDAGVSTALAAVRWELDSLADGVVDEPNARTRFVLVGRPGPPPPRTGADRTSVVLRLRNEPGALVAAMTEFSIRDIDLTRIESRPTRTELGTYIFFLDCVGHIDDAPVAEALKALHRRVADVRYLGSWPTGVAAGAAPPVTDEAAQWLAGLREGQRG
ncbi:prephenate dehydratase [Mycolicibacterium mucogenicum]|uniref:prephenate dehydratase n=1 Tax=Mycolicibacterium mucogenicum TaxID=56689 RepID=UPI00076A9C53|nr:prephenate dehydratase [Mycolicibacterium mucogenicum]